MSQPNILLITCHDLGRHLGCYDRPVHTPNLDRLASEGLRFDRYFVCAPQCSPSRAAMTTGRYPHRTGVMGLVNHGGWRVRDDCPTLAKTLTASGYDTWLWGFQHEHEDPARLGYRHDPIAFRPGEVPKILAQYITPRWCDWMRSGPAGPWFASVGFYETHLGWPKGERRTSPRQISAASHPPYLPDSPALRQDMTELAASLDRVDRAIGQILDTLDRSGQADRTLVVFTADHGLPLPRAKCTLYDPGLESALLMRWPGRIAANRPCSELLSGIDLMPTLLDLVGAHRPPDTDGSSFAGLLVGGDYTPRSAIFAEQTWHDAYFPMRSIRTDRYKLIRCFEERPANTLPADFYHCCAASRQMRDHFNYPIPRWEAFDLATDPLEQHSLIGDDPTRVDAIRPLAERLVEWMRLTNDPLLNGPVACPTPFG